MRALAVSYVLPPSLYPQAIQVGRLLAHCSMEIGAVCGTTTGRPDLDYDFGLDKALAFRLEVSFLPKLSGLAHQVARRFVPFYARVPDEFRSWVPLAEIAIRAHLERTGFAPDVLATFGEPMSDHLVGLRLKTQMGLRWIAHFSDPWVDNPFRRREFLARRVNARLESSVISEADRVIFTSKETLDLVMHKYPPGVADQSYRAAPQLRSRALSAAGQANRAADCTLPWQLLWSPQPCSAFSRAEDPAVARAEAPGRNSV